MITIVVNGKPRELDEPVSLDRFLQSLGLNTRFIAVALNGDVLERDSYAGVRLQDGDHLEVVRPVGGG